MTAAAVKRTQASEGESRGDGDGGANGRSNVGTGGHKEARRTRFDRGATEDMDAEQQNKTRAREVLKAWEMSEEDISRLR